MQHYFYEHFYSEGHSGFLGNVSISLIHKTDGFLPKKREKYWMRTLKNLAPLGLMLKVLSYIVYIRYMFLYSYFSYMFYLFYLSIYLLLSLILSSDIVIL